MNSILPLNAAGPPVNASRRALFATTALIAPAILAGCSLSAATIASVDQVIAQIQAVMPYVSGVASIIGAFVPGVSAVVTVVQNALTAAANVFNTVTSTMTVAAAQPIVTQIATYIGGALTAARQIIAALPASVQAQASALLGEAETILADIAAFANPTAPAPALRFAATLPTHLFVRAVR